MKKEQKPLSEGKQIGVVSNFFEHINVAAIKLDGNLKIGDKIKVVGGEVSFEQPVDSMQIHGKIIAKAKKGDDVGIKIVEKVRKGYRVYLV